MPPPQPNQCVRIFQCEKGKFQIGFWINLESKEFDLIDFSRF
jgi:hypothetical protein